MSGLLAHAAPISYRFPLPVWVYVLAAGTAVLLSAPAAAVAVTERSGGGARTRNLYPALRRLRLRPIVTVLLTLLALWSLVGGFGAHTDQGREFFENPMTVVTWVDFWVGLGLVSFLVGDVWDLVSPCNRLARSLDVALARARLPQLPYPAWLGRWPAVALLLVWSWMELVWDPAKVPRNLALILVLYGLGSLVACAVFGAEVWLGNGELFTVFARTFARFAPLELTPREPDEWLREQPERREVRLRPYGWALREGGPLPAGGGAFALSALATVVYDGFSQTNRYAGWEAHVANWLGLQAHTDVVATLLMVAIVVLFVAAYLAICGLVGLREPGGWRGAVERYTPTLIPIAAVYFAAHYFSYLLIAGQFTLGTLVDPFGHSWNPWGLGEYSVWFPPAAPIWWTQVALIVWGHVAAVFAAHRVSLRVGPERPARALAAQAPLVLLMVGYTMAGLWVLAQQLRHGG